MKTLSARYLQIQLVYANTNACIQQPESYILVMLKLFVNLNFYILIHL